MYETLKTTTKEWWTIKVEIRLNDECKNWHSEFAITWEIRSNRWIFESCWCIHEEIIEYFPHLKPIIDLHLSDCNGVPMYAIENWMYRMKQDLQKWLDYLRIKNISDIQKETLKAISDLWDWDMFYTVINWLWLCKQRKEEADEAIKLVWLERTEEMKAREIKNKIVYVPEVDEIKRLVNVKKQNEIEKIKNDEIKRYKEKISKEKRSHEIKIAMLEITLNDNWIYYNHTNNIKFNWKNYWDNFPKECIDDVIKLSEKMKFNIEL